MKKTLFALGLFMTMLFTIQPNFAACPCEQNMQMQNQTMGCACPCEKPDPCECQKPCDPCCNECSKCNECNKCDDCCDANLNKCGDNPGGYNCCCESWLDNIESYFCRVGFSECQKCEARKAINDFLCNVKNIDPCNCGCKESKCACREYKKELKKLDCEMKKIITKCQKDDYNCVKKEVKEQVNCCHKCLIWPFSRCACNTCDDCCDCCD